MDNRVNEQTFLLGQRKSLVGVISQSAMSSASLDQPAILILNAGIIHRVGPSRLSVLLARALAESGYTALRFDLSGIGDSEIRSDGLAPLESSLADIREALDWLESTGRLRRVVLIGLCSGANHALLYGGSDPRVIGLVLLDPAIPKTFRYYLRHFGPRLFRLGVWLSLIRGRHPLCQCLKERRVTSPPDLPQPQAPDLQSPEVRSFLERAYRRSLNHGIRFLAVFTGGRENRHNYREQMLDAFPKVRFGDRLRLEYFENADHTFTSSVERARLIGLIVDWVKNTKFSNAFVVALLLYSLQVVDAAEDARRSQYNAAVDTFSFQRI